MGVGNCEWEFEGYFTTIHFEKYLIVIISKWTVEETVWDNYRFSHMTTIT